MNSSLALKVLLPDFFCWYLEVVVNGYKQAYQTVMRGNRQGAENKRNTSRYCRYRVAKGKIFDLTQI